MDLHWTASIMMRNRKAGEIVLLAVALLFVSVTCLRADTINVLFGGTIDSLGASGCCETTDYGLGIDAGDHFVGGFSYDSGAAPIFLSTSQAKYTAADFSVRIGNLSLVATDSYIGVDTVPPGGLCSYVCSDFYIMGELSGGLYMTVGLFTGGGALLSDVSPPTYLSDADWPFGCFKITPDDFPPIAEGCGVWADEAILAQDNNQTPNDFFLKTIPVPELPTIFLLGVGLGALAAWGRRKTA
jgi:hypothetical protein